MNKVVAISILLSLLFCSSCKDDVALVPKPRIYPKVIYPQKSYTKFAAPNCPFSMEIPEYFQFLKDKEQNADEKKHKCWFDLYTEELNSYLHLSYIEIQDRKSFDKLVGDAFEMADKHNVKASYRQELVVTKDEEKVHGLIFEIDGPVATPVQFFLTDSTQHFLRGSLYFKSQINRDSIAPVYEFLKLDVQRLIESFEWE